MKRLLQTSALALASLLFASCLQNETTITLKKDGSGTITEETLLGAQMLAMLDQFSNMGGEADAAKKKDPVADMFSEEKAKTHAADLGEGVTVVKAEPLSKGDSKGARVTYHFDDINKLKFHLGDSVKNAAPGDTGEAAAKKDKTPPITFTYSDGKLVIHLPEPKKSEKKPDVADDPQQAQQLAAMKQMFADMKMSAKIVIEPGIGETDATNVEGNTITLMAVDFGKLVQNEAKFKEFVKQQPETPEAAQELLKGVDGIKIETKREVTVTVK
jgi:hypothetical protein